MNKPNVLKWSDITDNPEVLKAYNSYLGKLTYGEASRTIQRNDTFRKTLEMVQEWGNEWCCDKKHKALEGELGRRKHLCSLCWEALEQLGER